ncbi:MAG: Uncharacterized protein G01um10147_89 [Microgenomates group bacterium Gr01-1014_7]|nr:MAG: Uncharacterized protein G01um10147_89 [Microgenomates group bacterium Gr01-1014_7]
MEKIDSEGVEKITRPVLTENPTRLLMGVVIAALVLGGVTGYILSTKGNSSSSVSIPGTAAKTAQQDTRTFKDFAEGTVKARPQPSDAGEYVEGTHILERAGAVPVALTSSVVDLSKYEGKKVKVYGETQKALKEGWLMDVGKVEEIK